MNNPWLAAGSWQLAGARGEEPDALRSVNGSRHRKFRAYAEAVALADAVYADVAKWESFDRWSTGIQLVRAADSIGANIAEGMGRGRGLDRRRMLVIARGSLTETEHWLDRAGSRGLAVTGGLDEKLQEVARMLNGLIARESA